MKRNTTRAFVLLLLTFPFMVSGQNNKDLETYTKEKNKEYPSSKFSRVEIDNKHGDVSFTAWNKDSIRIDALVTVKAQDSEAGEKVMDFITIETFENNERIRFHTNFSEEFYSPHPFDIRYEVYLPADHEMKITNRYGNIDIASITGRMEIDLEHGDLKHTGMGVIDKLQGRFSFAEVQIGGLRNAQIELNNSGLTLDNADTAEIKGKYCQIDVGSAGKLTIKTHTGRLNTGQVQELIINGTFSFASIEEIKRKGQIEIDNGLLMIASIDKQLEELSVNNNNAPINISIPSSLAYTLHGEVTNGQFRHYRPNEFKIIKDIDRTSFSGGHNSQKQGVASIVLFNKNAGINIKE